MAISTPTQTLTIGSRGSQLALWQARFVAAQLGLAGVTTRIEIIKTTGDHLQTASLAESGGKGLFTKEIEDALLGRSIDLAVHSLKDLPTESREGLTIAAIPERENPFDAIVGKNLMHLREGAKVGTSSGRRAAQLRLLRPDLVIEPIRGNVDTRLRKQKAGEFDAILLAAAGLIRLGLEEEIAQIFTANEFCPAPGQGALAIQTRLSDDAEAICGRLNHTATSQAVGCERALLSQLGGGCQLPVGAFAQSSGAALDLLAVVVAPNGSKQLRVHLYGESAKPEQLGQRAAHELLSRGAAQLLTACG
jgi:hydroxymethylbilane synthase